MGALYDTPPILAAEPPTKSRRQLPAWKRHGWKLAVIGLLVAAPFGVFATYLMAGHNFHVVSPGQIYRSAQLDSSGLTRMVQEHGIKSILNLRGPNGDKAWYNAETNTAQQLGVRHIDYELSASKELTDAEMEQILALINAAPKPMLIHCKSGADRTGLVGALYLYSVEGKSAEDADRELTVLCGHIPYLFWEDTKAMDRSFWRYVGSHAQPQAKLNRPLSKRDTSPAANAVNN
jgi:protein tyrosine phosphatase (PTP) superfamily phosphohydrolase (DUF442 family)